MKAQISVLENWFTLQPLRLQLWFVVLGWAVLFLLFDLFLFSPLSEAKKQVREDIATTKTQIVMLQNQIRLLNDIAHNNRYLLWQKQKKLWQQQQNKFSHLSSLFILQWPNIIETILTPSENISIIELKNSPETLYSLPKNANLPPLYQQKLFVTFQGDYLNTEDYLTQIEGMLPVHWDSFSYTVTTYPQAKIDMELSLFYEKNS